MDKYGLLGDTLALSGTAILPRNSMITRTLVNKHQLFRVISGTYKIHVYCVGIFIHLQHPPINLEVVSPDTGWRYWGSAIPSFAYIPYHLAHGILWVQRHQHQIACGVRALVHQGIMIGCVRCRLLGTSKKACPPCEKMAIGIPLLPTLRCSGFRTL